MLHFLGCMVSDILLDSFSMSAFISRGPLPIPRTDEVRLIFHMLTKLDVAWSLLDIVAKIESSTELN